MCVCHYVYLFECMCHTRFTRKTARLVGYPGLCSTRGRTPGERRPDATMLQQILKDMYIDPDVLDALGEDQKKTLFLKMRQEQVRRWKEREEKAERDGGPGEPLRIRPKRANAKSVTWQLGRDGDIAVIVIGEVDEFKTSKIICSGLGEKKVPVLYNSARESGAGLKSNLVQRSTTEPATKENLPPKAQHTATPSATECSKEVSALPPLQVSLSERVSPSAVEKPELNPGGAPGDSPPPPGTTVFHPATRTGVITVRPASMLAALGAARTGRAKVASGAPQADPEPPTPTRTPTPTPTYLAAAVAAAADLPVPTAAPRACYQLLKPQRATPTQEPSRREGTCCDPAPPPPPPPPPPLELTFALEEPLEKPSKTFKHAQKLSQIFKTSTCIKNALLL
uniref:Zgc:100829 n=1 Tax=Gadus morhua TaxID=8049 RepID=A0A8C5BS06_GADMO